ncbi:MAG: SpoIIE family protein phosphatase [Spirochaetes bacterium]|nr:SpoIIE family protein phosphatase [Spirochaetota bacterium]
MEKKLKILALDDDKFIRNILQNIFCGKYDCRIASDYNEFNYILSDFNPDVIFLDIEMPDANGIEICTKLKIQKSSLYIIMMSGLDNPQTVQAAYEAGADDYIRKPFLPFEIAVKVDMIFKNRQYSINIHKLLSKQKKMTDSIFRLTNVINQNAKISERGNLFSTILQVTGFISCDYTAVVVDYKGTEKIEEKLSKKNFKNISFRKLRKILPVFRDRFLQQENVRLKTGDETVVYCYVTRIFFNEEQAGFLIIQNSSEFDSHVFDLISLYLDFVNLKGKDITTDFLLKEELRKERKEIEKVRNLQVALLPDFQEVEKFDVASTFIPMEELSGDFFDGYYINNSVYQIVVCDVSGHGIASSYVGSSIRGILRSIDPSKMNAAGIIQYLNMQMFQSFEGVYYFSTLVFCQLNVETGNVTFVSAGHPPCFYYDAEGDSYRKLENTGPLVGLMENAEFLQTEFSMNKGDILLIYTDGISEAVSTDKVMYGEENILNSFKKDDKTSSVDTVHSVIGSAYEYTGYNSFDDDVTILCVKRKL